MQLNNFTLIIQGPLNVDSLEHLKNYKSLGGIIVSHWKNDWQPLRDNAPKQSNLSFVTTSSKKAEELRSHFIGQAYALVSLLTGLNNVKTPFAIKMRSDEFFLDLGPLMEKFEEDTERLVYPSIYSRKFDSHPFHISDHIFVGKTDKLKSMCNIMTSSMKQKLTKDELEDRNNSNIWSMQRSGNSCEQIWGQAWIQACGNSLGINVEKQLEHFAVIDVNSLAPYLIRNNTLKQVWRSDYITFNDGLVTYDN